MVARYIVPFQRIATGQTARTHKHTQTLQGDSDDEGRKGEGSGAAKVWPPRPTLNFRRTSFTWRVRHSCCSWQLLVEKAHNNVGVNGKTVSLQSSSFSFPRIQAKSRYLCIDGLTEYFSILAGESTPTQVNAPAAPRGIPPHHSTLRITHFNHPLLHETGARRGRRAPRTQRKLGCPL